MKFETIKARAKKAHAKNIKNGVDVFGGVGTDDEKIIAGNKIIDSWDVRQVQVLIRQFPENFDRQLHGNLYIEQNDNLEWVIYPC